MAAPFPRRNIAQRVPSRHAGTHLVRIGLHVDEAFKQRCCDTRRAERVSPDAILGAVQRQAFVKAITPPFEVQ